MPIMPPKPKIEKSTAIKLESKIETSTLKKTLIEYVRKNPILWDNQHEEYRDTSWKNVIWADFITTYYDGNENVTVEGLKKTWKSLYDAFVRQYNSYKANKSTDETGSCDDPNDEKKKWEYFDAMLFLREPSMRDNEPTVSLKKQLMPKVVKKNESNLQTIDTYKFVKGDNESNSRTVDTFKLVKENGEKLTMVLNKLDRNNEDNMNFCLDLANSMSMIKDPKQMISFKSNVWQLFATTISETDDCMW